MLTFKKLYFHQISFLRAHHYKCALIIYHLLLQNKTSSLPITYQPPVGPLPPAPVLTEAVRYIGWWCRALTSQLETDRVIAAELYHTGLGHHIEQLPDIIILGLIVPCTRCCIPRVNYKGRGTFLAVIKIAILVLNRALHYISVKAAIL